jgi:hypothetical protein
VRIPSLTADEVVSRARSLTEEMTERYSVAQAEVEAALEWWEETKWWESGGNERRSRLHRPPRITVARPGYELAFRERDIGFEPTTFSLGMRSGGIGRGSSR